MASAAVTGTQRGSGGWSGLGGSECGCLECPRATSGLDDTLSVSPQHGVVGCGQRHPRRGRAARGGTGFEMTGPRSSLIPNPVALRESGVFYPETARPPFSSMIGSRPKVFAMPVSQSSASGQPAAAAGAPAHKRFVRLLLVTL